MQLAKTGDVNIHAINWKDQRKAAVDWLDELGDPYARIGSDLENKAGIEWGCLWCAGDLRDRSRRAYSIQAYRPVIQGNVRRDD